MVIYLKLQLLLTKIRLDLFNNYKVYRIKESGNIYVYSLNKNL
ncbi:hypothetical protein QGA_2911 [Clostridioides difficile CD181]|nr:hypothetical protein QGA_2911 [Clostridioides difficile CD181]